MQSVSRVPTADEWGRFDAYAKRVRRLIWTTSECERLDSAVGLHLLDILKGRYNEHAAFPRLKALTIDMKSILKSEHWTVFIHSGLEKITTSTRSFEVFPSTTSLSKGSSVVPYLSSSAACITSILFDSSVLFSQETFRVVAQLPGLRRLALVVDTSSHNFAELPNFNSPAFPALRSLRLALARSLVATADGCSLTTSFLKLISSRALRTLDIRHFDAALTQESLCEMLQTITQFSGTLKRCSLDICSWWSAEEVFRDNQRTSAIRLSAILPHLLQLAGTMQDLELWFVPLDVNRRDLLALLRVYPDARSLVLGIQHPNTRSNLCVDDLADVARFCPQLRELGLRVRVTEAADDAVNGATDTPVTYFDATTDHLPDVAQR